MASSNEIVRAIDDGCVVGLPTETFYGLAVDALSSEAMSKLRALKPREKAVAYPLLVADESMLDRIGVEPTAVEKKLIQAFWPGPLTIVFSSHRSDLVCLAPDNTVAIRVSSHTVATDIVAAVGRPVTITSANVHGGPPAKTSEEVKVYFGDEFPVLDGGEVRGGMPSTIVRMDGTLKILRSGAIEPAAIEKVVDAAVR